MRQKPQEARAGEVMRGEGESINMFQEVKLRVHGERGGVTNTDGRWPPEDIDGRLRNLS